MNEDSLVINQFELMVLLDAAHGSLRVADGGTIWKFDEKQRKGVVDDIYERMYNKKDVEVK